jgi:hypothetical protein
MFLGFRFGAAVLPQIFKACQFQQPIISIPLPTPFAVRPLIATAPLHLDPADSSSLHLFYPAQHSPALRGVYDLRISFSEASFSKTFPFFQIVSHGALIRKVFTKLAFGGTARRAIYLNRISVLIILFF